MTLSSLEHKVLVFSLPGELTDHFIACQLPILLHWCLFTHVMTLRSLYNSPWQVSEIHMIEPWTWCLSGQRLWLRWICTEQFRQHTVLHHSIYSDWLLQFIFAKGYLFCIIWCTASQIARATCLCMLKGRILCSYLLYGEDVFRLTAKHILCLTKLAITSEIRCCCIL